ncbi:MAG: spore coat associated protein CotJA [Clostridia bacterium]|nr:spore coat associated protein CotJA [Clostridia bacterium]
MSDTVTAVRQDCCCRVAARDLPTVPAGSVSGGLGACGWPTELLKLPRTLIRPQNYLSGFCPQDALENGTLFPELADLYK